MSKLATFSPVSAVGGSTVDVNIDHRWIDSPCRYRPYSPVGGSTVDVDIDLDRSTGRSISGYVSIFGCVFNQWDHFSPFMGS